MSHSGDGGNLMTVPVPALTSQRWPQTEIIHNRIQVQIRRCLNCQAAVARVTRAVFPDTQQLIECSSVQETLRSRQLRIHVTPAWKCTGARPAAVSC